MKESVRDLKRQAKDLEEILLGMEAESNVMGEQVLPKKKCLLPLDYAKVKRNSEKMGGNIVEAVIQMYLPVDFIRDHDYICQKMEVDKLTLSDILFQVTTAEHAIMKLLEEIDNGNVQARSFEVLSSLQRSKMEISRQLSQFMVSMESNYKQLKFDYQTSNVEKKITLPVHEVEITKIEAPEQEDPSTRFRGTKNLMSMVQTYVEQSKQQKDEPTTQL